jgi:hypothetical protein
MRSSRALWCALGVVIAASSACVTSPATRAGSRYDLAQSPRAHATGTKAWLDSVVAQNLADQEGPGLSVSATSYSGPGGRRIRANVRLDNDAYLVVGHVGPDGIVRILFPLDPHDNGLVVGGRSYAIPEFFAGYASDSFDRYSSRFDLFRFATSSRGAFGPLGALGSGDAGEGYVFAVASWRPMHFEGLSEDGAWSEFELTSARSRRDPRPAIHEVANVLVGTARESFSVKFARYVNPSAASQDYFNFSNFMSGACYARNGFVGLPRFAALTPAFAYNSVFDLFGTPYYYRGRYYLYDDMTGCSHPAAYSFPYTQLAGGTPYSPNPTPSPEQPRTRFTPGGSRPGQPWEPQPVPPDAGGLGDTLPQASTAFRPRGLIAGGGGEGLTPRGASGRRPARRPTIQQMVNGGDGSGERSGPETWGSNRPAGRSGEVAGGGRSADGQDRRRGPGEWNGSGDQNGRHLTDDPASGRARSADAPAARQPADRVPRDQQGDRSASRPSDGHAPTHPARREPTHVERAPSEPARSAPAPHAPAARPARTSTSGGPPIEPVDR